MTTRTKTNSLPSTQNTTIISKRVENSWVLLIKDNLFQNDSFSFITLPHPGHNEPAKFCLDNVNKKMYEVITFSEPYRSWFIGETVKSDGSIMLITPVNPLFLVLPKLRDQCINRAIPLEDLLSEKGFDKILHFIPSLNSIGDLKGSGDMKAYKYNEEKTLLWLKERVLRLAKVLKEKNIHVTSGSASATFVTSNIDNNHIDEEFYLKYAYGMVSEYLQQDLADLLETSFNFKPVLIESLGKKRKSENHEGTENKRIKQEPSKNLTEENVNNIIETKVQKNLTSKEKTRLKAASGTKTLSAFFTRKT